MNWNPLSWPDSLAGASGQVVGSSIGAGVDAAGKDIVDYVFIPYIEVSLGSLFVLIGLILLIVSNRHVQSGAKKAGTVAAGVAAPELAVGALAASAGSKARGVADTQLGRTATHARK